MQLIYTTSYARSKVRTESDYQSWVKSLKDKDEVLLQKFHPPDHLAGFRFDMWSFEKVRIHKNSLYIANSGNPGKTILDSLYPLKNGGGIVYLFNPSTGKCCFSDGSDYGEVFPARIVPCSSDMNPEPGTQLFGNRPIYEPIWSLNPRHLFLTQGRSQGMLADRMKRTFPNSYVQDVARAVLVTVFCNDYNFDPKTWLIEQNWGDDITYLYTTSNP